jgi:hypothetical protein
MLSRKYYKLIAESIKDNTIVNNRKMLPTINKVSLVSDLCAKLQADNSLFNSSKFIDACDVAE